MFRRRFDLPLERDPSARLIPWIIAVMAYLAGMALVGALLAQAASARWSQGLTGSLTVQILPGMEPDPSEFEARTAMAITLLRGTPGIASAEQLDAQRVAALLRPWIGAEGLQDLPLPAMIDVRLVPGASVDFKALATRLDQAVPGAILDDHQQWLNRAIGLARSAVLMAAVIMAMVAAAAALVTVFGTRTALAVHRSVIEVLHLIGAQDVYVARQFQAHALRLGLKGGSGGLLGVLVTVVVLAYALGPLPVEPLPGRSFGLWPWAGLLLLPLGTALVAMLTARITVLRTLQRMI